MSPYNALFGEEMYNGLEVFNLPEDEAKKIKTAKDLFELLVGLLTG